MERRTGPINEVLSRLITSDAVVARRDGTSHTLFPVALHPQEGEALRDWIKREGAAASVEIGLGYGLSGLFICAGLVEAGRPDAKHVALDPYQTSRFSDLGLQSIEEAGLSAMVEFHAEGSEIALPRFLAEGRSFDFAEVDGNHRFEGVFLDLIYLGRLLRPGKVVFLDDYQLPSAQKAVRFCTTNLGWTLEEDRTADEFHRWAVVRTPTAELNRAFDHFVDF